MQSNSLVDMKLLIRRGRLSFLDHSKDCCGFVPIKMNKVRKVFEVSKGKFQDNGYPSLQFILL